eukprot:TRINITY_DN4992_c0_g2_i2.p1 TRINITY_DN4992_c0_g2~~TRINITY_DN4992_c0_g2_i2.p1  ORF type:complete len:220 (-),score=33.21 TRINITY_DN4992_c0_g2_i2:285-944(-)
MDSRRSPGNKRRALSLPTEMVPFSRSVCGGNMSLVEASGADGGRAVSSPDRSQRTVVVVDRPVSPEDKESARTRTIYRDFLLTFFVKSATKAVLLKRLYALERIFLVQRGVHPQPHTHLGQLINETFHLSLDDLLLPKGGHPKNYKFMKNREWFRRGIAFPKGRFVDGVFTLQWDNFLACPEHVRDFCRAVNIRSPQEVTFHLNDLDKKVCSNFSSNYG